MYRFVVSGSRGLIRLFVTDSFFSLEIVASLNEYMQRRMFKMEILGHPPLSFIAMESYKLVLAIHSRLYENPSYKVDMADLFSFHSFSLE